MLNTKLLKGSFILLIAFGLFNFFNFVYQFAMARLLSVAEYGILAALFAIIYIFAIFSESIQTVIAKYTVRSDKNGQIRNLISRSLRKGRFLATIAFSLYLVISVPLSLFLEISYALLALNGLIIYFMFSLPVSRGTLQGRKQFVSLGVNIVAESLFKLLLGVGLVMLGWHVYGAVVGFLLGAAISLLISFIPLRDIYKHPEEASHTADIYSYAKPTTFITTTIVLFYSCDVILAKFLFSPESAGAYAIASILGKIILWISIPIGKAMFPLSAEKQDEQKKGPIFGTALFILGGIIAVSLSIFYFFSDAIVSFFSGKSLSEATEILFYLGIAFSIIAIANITLIYRLSLGPIRNYSVLFICNAIQILILLTFSQNLRAFSLAFIASSIVLLFASVLFVRLNRHV